MPNVTSKAALSTVSDEANAAPAKEAAPLVEEGKIEEEKIKEIPKILDFPGMALFARRSLIAYTIRISAIQTLRAQMLTAPCYVYVTADMRETVQPAAILMDALATRVLLA